MNFTHLDNFISIDTQAGTVNYNGLTHKITELYFFNNLAGKLETEEHIFKFSKNQLLVFDKQTKILVDTLAFTPNQIDTEINTHILSEDQIKSEPILVNSFEFKTDVIINLYVDAIRKENYTISIKKGDTVILSEKVVLQTKNGSDTVYTSESGNILTVGNIRTSKWNGSPIGKIF